MCERKGRYKFVKVRDVGADPGTGRWYLVADSKEAIDAHWKKYGKKEIEDGVRDLSQYIGTGGFGHFSTPFAILVELETKLHGGNFIANALVCENKVYQTRLGFFLEGDREQLLDKGFKVLKVCKGITEIVDERYSDDMLFPDEKKPTADDIRVMRWENPMNLGGGFGKHWYAKVGHVDVVDAKGRQKWNSKEEAMRAAEEFIKTMDWIN